MLQVKFPMAQLPRIEILNPTKEQRDYIKGVLRNNYIHSNDYKIRREINPFLQCDSEDYILIEFWNDDRLQIQNFVDYLNEGLGFKEIKEI